MNEAVALPLAGVPAQALIVIGASSGGPQAVATLLAGLPRDLPAAVVVVQHVELQFAPGLVDWLDGQVGLAVVAAAEGEVPREGRVYVAVRDRHLVLRANGTLGYTLATEGKTYRPSIDVLFASVARYWSGIACGVLLTGMGRDGALGLLELRRRGAYTVAQDRASSQVYGMPKVARELGAVDAVLPLQDIAGAILRRINTSKCKSFKGG